jgi:tRNA (cytidine32/guanosine34-2'-O)-methyltransferase
LYYYDYYVKFLQFPYFTSISYFFRNKVPLLYANCKAAVDKELAIQLPQCKGVSFTADYWTSRSCDPYLGMTLHFITPEFEMKKLMVACKSAEGRHTGQNIANHIDKV